MYEATHDVVAVKFEFFLPHFTAVFQLVYLVERIIMLEVELCRTASNGDIMRSLSFSVA